MSLMKSVSGVLFAALLGFAVPSFALPVPIADVTVTGTATLVKAANQFRKSLSCTNTSSSVAVRWGSSTVTATQGQRIAASVAIEINDPGAIYMISEGANVTMSCTEETK